MLNKALVFALFYSLGSFALANSLPQERAKNAAVVNMVKGKAMTEGPNGPEVLRRGMWLREGAVIKTFDRSLARLTFVDKSTMNVGPNSEIKIEKFSADEAGVVNVISGKIRAEVTKDYLNMDKEKSKMFVKSRSAVMGIRGTDFLFSAHKKTGAATAVLFEGSVVFNSYGQADRGRDLESVVSNGRRILPGQFSVSRPDLSKPTIPAKLSSSQFRALRRNRSFSSEAAPSKSIKRSIVPPGLSGKVVSPDESGLNNGLEKLAKLEVKSQAAPKAPEAESKGFARGNEIKPADGSIVHVDSGAIIPMGMDSKYDENSQEWVSTNFDVAQNGQVVPPEGYELTDDGKLLKESNGQVKEIELEIRPVDQTPPLDKMLELDISDRAAPSPEVEPAPSLARPAPQPGELLKLRDDLQKIPVGSQRSLTSPVRIRIDKK